MSVRLLLEHIPSQTLYFSRFLPVVILPSNLLLNGCLVFVQGPVHSYAAAPGGKTAYLSELQSGRKVLVVDSQGRTRNALVGRVKIESRPLVFIEAEVSGFAYVCKMHDKLSARTVSI